MDSKGESMPLTLKECYDGCQVRSSDRNGSDRIGGVTFPQSVRLKASIVLAPPARPEFSLRIPPGAFTVSADQKLSRQANAAKDMLSHAVCYKLPEAALSSEYGSYVILESLQIPKLEDETW